MSLHDDLLEQAREFLDRDPRRPKQSNLRRAISTAYYALFHLLLFEASTLITTGIALRHLVSRAFIHSEMNRASKCFAGGHLARRFDNLPCGRSVPAKLKVVAGAFVNLQQARHEADYNLASSFSKAEVMDLLNLAEQAFQEWSEVKTDEWEFARVYLLSLLLWDRWEKVR